MGLENTFLYLLSFLARYYHSLLILLQSSQKCLPAQFLLLITTSNRFSFFKNVYALKIDWRMRVPSQSASHLLNKIYCFILSKLSYAINNLYLDHNSHSAKFSSTKHHIHDSPGSYDLITGCIVSLKCFVPCLFLEASQHPT